MIKKVSKSANESQVGVRVDKTLKRQLEGLATAQRRTIAQIARFALEEYVQRHSAGVEAA